MALHIVYEAVLDYPAGTDLENMQERLTGELSKSGTVVVLVYQTNKTQEDGR